MGCCTVTGCYLLELTHYYQLMTHEKRQWRWLIEQHLSSNNAQSSELKPYFAFQWLLSCVLFIPCFRLLVFGILVTLVAWLSFCFFCLAHLALQNVNKDFCIFLTSTPKVTKNKNEKWDERNISQKFAYKMKRLYNLVSCFFFSFINLFTHLFQMHLRRNPQGSSCLFSAKTAQKDVLSKARHSNTWAGKQETDKVYLPINRPGKTPIVFLARVSKSF